MVIFDILIISYANNAPKVLSPRGVNEDLSEDCKVMTASGESARLDDKVRRMHEANLNVAENNLMYKCTKLYVTASGPGISDNFFAVASDVVEIDLNATAGEAHRTFNSQFPGEDKPMVIVKLFYVTRQT